MDPTLEQQRVIDAVTGPLRVLAGAGTGKTTVATMRIANQVRAGVFNPRSLLAVTFTRSAAHEMRRRLAEQGVDGPLAGTFHATARWILAKWWPSWKGAEAPQHLEHPAWLVALLKSLPPERAKDAEADIQWLKRQRATPDTCLAVLKNSGHPSRLDPGLLSTAFKEYEFAKQAKNLMDYQDMLEGCIQLLEHHAPASAWFRETFRAFTVDEYQDLDPLQEALLKIWVGDSEEILVVGDPYQSIFGFAGSSNAYLEDFSRWRPAAVTYPLTINFRSTPQVLRPANALAVHLSNPPRLLTGSSTGPEPLIRGFHDGTQGAAWVATEISRLITEEHMEPAEIAILYRWASSSARYERALTQKEIPHEVVGDPAFLNRPHVGRIITDASAADSWEEALKVAHRSGTQELVGDDLMPEQAAIERAGDIFVLEDLMRECSETTQLKPEDLPTWLLEKLGIETSGVRLMTLHRAKGLEFDAVFLPEVERGKLPAFFATDEDDERRLLYVGLTRARRHLYVTWSKTEGESPFLRQLA